MPYKDPDKQREYKRQQMRERRAREARGKPASERAATGRAKAVASVTTRQKVYEGSLDVVARLEAFDQRSLTIGERLLAMAEDAVDTLEELVKSGHPLPPLEIKRMVETALKLKERSAEKLTKEEERTEQAIFVTEKVIGNPDALSAVQKLLTYSSADDLARCVDGSGARPADSVLLRALHEQTGVDPLPASSPS